MSFWGKTAKITAIAGMAVGGALTITGAALLGVGCEATYENSDGSKYGIGASSWGNYWDANGNKTSFPTEKSYWDTISDARKMTNPGPMEKAAIQAADETIAGAVLFPIFVLVLGASIAIFFINRKKA